MKIIVFADSHHDTNSMIYVLQEETPDMVIHLGDNVSDAMMLKNIFPEISFEMVQGNCDFEKVKDEKILTLEGATFFITHGHRYRVKSHLRKLTQKGLDKNADIVLFGHTHKAYLKKEKEMWMINPGSISSMYKRGKHPSYAKILIEDGNIDCEIVERK